MKRALRQLVVALRASGRASGGQERHPLASRAALDRVLGQEPQPGAELTAIKTALAKMVQCAPNDPEGSRQARQAADLMLAAAPRPLAEADRVRVSLENTPAGFSERDAEALLGTSDGWLSAVEAAVAVHRLSGRVVGGAGLRVVVELPRGARLPAVPRDARADRGRWGRAAPWLPHLDELGRRSLTPRAMARRLARFVQGRAERVVDACCGCGGNAVAFAATGLPVLAVELDPQRAELARQNAAALGVSRQLSVRTGSIEQMLPRSLREGDLLFVDPPWESGPDRMGERSDDFSVMFRRLPRLAEAVRSWPRVVLKLPRAFDVESLPGGSASWTLRYERGSPSSGDAQVVRMITASRGLSPASAATR